MIPLDVFRLWWRFRDLYTGQAPRHPLATHLRNLGNPMIPLCVFKLWWDSPHSYTNPAGNPLIHQGKDKKWGNWWE
jgi:hypothetical protein